jgi:predicted O-linked N-acetylglucosamine transferase (SPINDLY family)
VAIAETIARTETEYIEIAAKLGLDSTWRQGIVYKMRERLDLLYDDLTCVQGLETFYKSVILQGS